MANGNLWASAIERRCCANHDRRTHRHQHQRQRLAQLPHRQLLRVRHRRQHQPPHRQLLQRQHQQQHQLPQRRQGLARHRGRAPHRGLAQLRRQGPNWSCRGSGRASQKTDGFANRCQATRRKGVHRIANECRNTRQTNESDSHAESCAVRPLSLPNPVAAPIPTAHKAHRRFADNRCNDNRPMQMAGYSTHIVSRRNRIHQ